MSKAKKTNCESCGHYWNDKCIKFNIANNLRASSTAFCCADYIKKKKTNIEKVAKMLGVGIGEKFNVLKCDEYFNNPHYLLDDGLFDKNGSKSPFCLGLLLQNNLFIQKLPQKPWKPKYGDIYYCVNLYDGKEECDFIDSDKWVDGMGDYYFFNARNCFKTEEEITPEMIEKILKEMKGKYESQN